MDSETPEQSINPALAHQRALGRARAARLRARRKASAHVQNERAPAEHGNGKGNGHGNGIAHAVRDLRPREVRVVQGILDGKTQTQALRDAGFHPSSHTVLDTIKAPLKAAMMACGLTVETVVANTTEALKATTPMLTAEGCIERTDWSARQGGRRDAIALLDRAGLLPAATPQAVGTQITVNVLRYDDHRSTISDNDAVDAPALEAESSNNA
jgi:hypothetical protein